MVRLHPNLLLYDVQKTIIPRIASLKRLFPESPKLLMRAPDLLYHDPETILLPKMQMLRELLPGVDIARMIRQEVSSGGRHMMACKSACAALAGHSRSMIMHIFHVTKV